MTKCSFEKKYKEGCYWGLKPSKEVRKILRYKKSGRVLDLGAGEGRNALFLARKGFEVMGVEISPSSLEKFSKLAKKLKAKAQGKVADIKDFHFDGLYDIIISTVTLHFLPKKSFNSVIKKMKEHTSKGGLNLITVFTVEDPGFKVHPKKMRYFQKTELKDFYKEWELLEYREFLTKPERHGKGGKWHQHGIAFLLARKVRAG